MMETTNNPPVPNANGAPTPEIMPCEMQMTVAPKTKGNPFLTRGSMVLLGIYATGFLALYALGLRGGPSVAMGKQDLVYAKVDAALTLLNTKPSASQLAKKTDAKAIANDFYTAARQRQIDPTKLAGNPFIFRQKQPEISPVKTVKETVEKNKEDEVRSELKAAMAEARKLRLQSILVGKEKAAMVSNNLVTIGQTINGWTVSKIDPREVELTWQDQKYILELLN